MTIPIPELTAAFMLAFARVGTLVMLLPAIGDATIPGRLRLGFALLLSLMLLPFVRGILPAVSGPAAVIGLLIGEVVVGLIIGLSIRMIVAALQIAGTVTAQALGLSYATTVNPSYGGQDASIANFLNLLGLTLIFATDLHHLVVAAIRESYGLLPPAGTPETGEVVRLAIGAVGRGFALALQISAPFIAFGLMFNIGLGILSRLMPQMQVFFVGLPVTIIVGMLVLVAVVGLMMNVFLGDLGRFLADLGAR